MQLRGRLTRTDFRGVPIVFKSEKEATTGLQPSEGLRGLG